MGKGLFSGGMHQPTAYRMQEASKHLNQSNNKQPTTSLLLFFVTIISSFDDEDDDALQIAVMFGMSAYNVKCVDFALKPPPDR